MKFFGFALLTTLAVVAFASPVSAQADIKFVIPVELHSLHPDISRFNVRCTAYIDQSMLGTVASGFTDLDSDGNYLGAPVELELNLPNASEQEKSAANRYICNLQIFSMSDQRVFTPAQDYAEEYGRPKAGTEFNRRIIAAITQGG